VQIALKRYRASVLKAACEGRLVPTEAELAKTENREFQTGEELLARILTKRRQNWQGRGKYKEPAAPVTANLPPFPEGWTVASLEQLTSADRPICYGILMPKENVATGVLFVKVKDMKGDKIDLDGLHRTTPEIAAKYARAFLKTGDVLLAIRGTYGRVAEVPKELNGGNITQDTARLDVTGLVSHRYVATCLRNPDCQNYFKRVARGVAVKGVNIGDVKPTPIPLPSLAEQTRIVVEVERRLSVVEELGAAVVADLQRANRLRQSILQTAFIGYVL
jgi:type I restriction enzyme S subunit